MLKIVATALALSAAPAAAQNFPCPAFQAGWAVSGSGPITSVAYDQSSQILSVVWNYREATQFWPVPISVMIAFNQSHNLLRTYNSYVASSYNALLLQENYNCPVLQEGGGYIFTDNVRGSGIIGYDLLQENGNPLLTTGGRPFWLYSQY